MAAKNVHVVDDDGDGISLRVGWDGHRYRRAKGQSCSAVRVAGTTALAHHLFTTVLSPLPCLPAPHLRPRTCRAPHRAPSVPLPHASHHRWIWRRRRATSWACRHMNACNALLHIWRSKRQHQRMAAQRRRRHKGIGNAQSTPHCNNINVKTRSAAAIFAPHFATCLLSRASAACTAVAPAHASFSSGATRQHTCCTTPRAGSMGTPVWIVRRFRCSATRVAENKNSESGTIINRRRHMADRKSVRVWAASPSAAGAASLVNGFCPAHTPLPYALAFIACFAVRAKPSAQRGGFIKVTSRHGTPRIARADAPFA